MLCKHRRTWLMFGGHGEWCYECGALRRMAVVEPNHVYPKTRWTRPVGKDGKNPYPMIELKKEASDG